MKKNNLRNEIKNKSTNYQRTNKNNLKCTRTGKEHCNYATDSVGFHITSSSKTLTWLKTKNYLHNIRRGKAVCILFRRGLHLKMKILTKIHKSTSSLAKPKILKLSTVISR